MSHASVIVVIDDPNAAIDTAVAEQMAPFDENGEWFRDGSRWDWWIVGGRYTGALDGYDPSSDPANQETCNLCNGTGVRPEGLKQFGQAWFDACHGCNGCNGEGTRVKLRYNPHLGDIANRSQIEAKKFRGAYAFLRNRHWNEPERLGFFGGTAATECELKHPDNPDVAVNKCLTEDPATGARIVTWNEPWEIWRDNFWHRFIEKLPPDSRLVVVDYHV